MGRGRDKMGLKEHMKIYIFVRVEIEMHAWRNIFRGKREIDKNCLSQHSPKHVIYTLHMLIF